MEILSWLMMVYTRCIIPLSLFFGVRKCIGRQGVDKVGISDSDVAIGNVLQKCFDEFKCFFFKVYNN